MEVDDSRTGPVSNFKSARRLRHPQFIEKVGKPFQYRTLKPAIKQQRPLFIKGNSRGKVQHGTGHPKKSCRIHLCRLLDCDLRTHKYNQDTLDRFNKPNSHDIAACQTSSDNDKPSLDVEHNATLQILRGGVDGFPALPLDEQHRCDYVELFHHFFTQQYDRIIRIVTPHEIATFQKQKFVTEKNKAFARALSAPIFCLHVCASSHHQIVFHKDGSSSSPITTLIQVTLTTLLRDILNNVELTSTYANDLTLVILMLVMYETSMNDYSALLFHRKAMCHLTRKQGGVHNMGKWIPFIMLLDRLISIFTALPPVLCKCPDRAIQRPSKYAHIYGSYFERNLQNQNLNQRAIHDFCFDTCRAIEVMEHQGPLFDTSQELKANYQDLHYLCYLKENLAGQFAHLNAELAMKGAADASQLHRCILLATKIIDHAVLHDNYMVSIATYCANTTRSIMDQCFKLPLFLEASPILLWILFVLLSMEVRWDGRNWALLRLYELLELKYSGFGISTWPTDWKTHEYNNLRAFVWSDAYFATGFIKCCSELELIQTVTVQENNVDFDEITVGHPLNTVFDTCLDATGSLC